MADIPNRSELEAELARRFSKLSAQHRRRLLSLLGDPPNMGNIPLSFWEEVAAELNGSLLPLISNIAIGSAERMLGGLPIGVDWALVNERASTWARQYTYDLIRQINDSSRRAVQGAISSFFEQGLTRADLEAKLINIFGPIRAEMIAVTEVTRAAVEGEKLIANELEKEGVAMIPVWLTDNDELVCSVCAPRHNQVIDDGFFPPAHPRCRCDIRYDLPKVSRG